MGKECLYVSIEVMRLLILKMFENYDRVFNNFSS